MMPCQFISSQQEAVVYKQCKQNYGLYCELQLNASGGNRKCRSLNNGQTSSSAKSPSETFNAKKLWAAVLCFKWHQCFAQGRDSLEDDERSGLPKAVRTEHNIEEVATLVRANHSQLVNIAAAIGISHGTCHRILPDNLNMSRFSVFHVS
jgi:hypothetical protein